MSNNSFGIVLFLFESESSVKVSGNANIVSSVAPVVVTRGVEDGNVLAIWEFDRFRIGIGRIAARNAKTVRFANVICARRVTTVDLTPTHV